MQSSLLLAPRASRLAPDLSRLVPGDGHCRRRLHRRPELHQAADRLAAGLARRVRAGGRNRQHALVGGVRRSRARSAGRGRGAREPGRADRGRARRPVPRRTAHHALAVLPAVRLRRRTRAATARARRASRQYRPARIATTACIRPPSAHPGRSICSDACGGRPRPRRRRCIRASRAGAASSSPWSPAWRRATSCCADSTASWRVAQATAENYRETQELFALRFKGGVVSEVEVAQVESQYQQALAVIPALERQIAVQENLLSILLGRNPELIPRGMTIDQLIEPGHSRRTPRQHCSSAGPTSWTPSSGCAPATPRSA